MPSPSVWDTGLYRIFREVGRTCIAGNVVHAINVGVWRDTGTDTLRKSVAQTDKYGLFDAGLLEMFGKHDRV